GGGDERNQQRTVRHVTPPDAGPLATQRHEWQSGDRRALAPRKPFCTANARFHRRGLRSICAEWGAGIPRAGLPVGGGSGGVKRRIPVGVATRRRATVASSPP